MHEAMDRATIRRHTAVELALDILGPGERTVEKVLEIAKQIDDFLRCK